MTDHQIIIDWHEIVRTGDLVKLSELLDADIVFHSPVVHTPQIGKELALMYLGGAFHVLRNDSFQYIREVVGEHDAVLEFRTEVDGVVINGVDIIKWNDTGNIIDFKVMLRPLKAINFVHQKMADMLTSLK